MKLGWWFGLLLLTFLATTTARAEWIEAGPIWNDMDAQRKCPKTCDDGKWDGKWKTTKEGKMSVCNCSGTTRQSSMTKGTAPSRVKPQRVSAGKKGTRGGVDAGSIWNDMMAEQRCPKACAPRNWDGRWSYVDIGHSICYCRR